jgi:glucosamine--fructose-6-phosphate aminotransferase (isomerizing)
MTTETRTFAHHMLREIFEQPAALRATFAAYVRDGGFNGMDSAAELLRTHNDIVIAASGSSRHAGLAAEIMLEDAAGHSVDVEYASEYIYRSTNTKRNPLVIVISQSGETADTLAALREAKRRGHPTIAVTNVAVSTMAREADVSLPTLAGVERAVPATKSFTTQLMVLRLLSLVAAQARGCFDEAQIRQALAALEAAPENIEAHLDGWLEQAQRAAHVFADARTLLYLGRAVHYPIAREGALKLKESSYVHAEGYPTGELKHGPNALVSRDTPLVVLATVDRTDAESTQRYEKTVALLEDMRTQGARALVVGDASDGQLRGLATAMLDVGNGDEYTLPLEEVVPLQMFAYFMAIERGVNVDSPRNLVKSVVTE